MDYPLTHNQAKALVADGRQRPLEYGSGKHVKGDESLINDQEKQHDEHQHKKRTEDETARAEKAASKAAQRAEQAAIKSSHAMTTRSNRTNMPIHQPGKFGRDMKRSF